MLNNQISMSQYSKFKSQYSFQDRVSESTRILKKHPERIPIILEKSKANGLDLPDIVKVKYLVPRELTVCQFNFFVRQRLKLASDESLFLFINKKVISSICIIGDVYQYEKDADGFMYVEYAREQTFG